MRMHAGAGGLRRAAGAGRRVWRGPSHGGCDKTQQVLLVYPYIARLERDEPEPHAADKCMYGGEHSSAAGRRGERHLHCNTGWR